MARLKGKPFMFRSGGSLWRLETSAAGSVLNPCWQPFPFSNTSARSKQTQCPVEADDVKQNLQILQYLNFGSCRRAQCLKKGAHLCKCLILSIYYVWAVWSTFATVESAHWLTCILSVVRVQFEVCFLWCQFLLVLDFKQAPSRGELGISHTSKLCRSFDLFKWIFMI